MSHLPERKEKQCLNCQAALHGRFCHVCGQENIEPKESFWHLVTHFVYDIVHFDGKFFSTLKYLLFRPGFLSNEYLRGRRADYLHPIRMYVFTSAFFFLIFFSFYQKEEGGYLKEDNKKKSVASVLKKLENQRKSLTEALKTGKNVIDTNQLKQLLVSTTRDIDMLKRDSTKIDSVKSNLSDFTILSFDRNNANKYVKTVAQYDSIQAALPASKRDGFIIRKIERQTLHLREKYHNDGKAILNSITQKFIHLFPQMLFISLPIFGLLLQLLYVRRKNYFYVNHIIYSIHLYCAIFIIILLGLWTNSLFELLHLHSNWVSTIFTLLAFFYWYKSMRLFYLQKRAKTIVKYLIALFLSIFIMSFLFVVFFLFSAMAL